MPLNEALQSSPYTEIVNLSQAETRTSGSKQVSVGSANQKIKFTRDFSALKNTDLDNRETAKPQITTEPKINKSSTDTLDATKPRSKMAAVINIADSTLGLIGAGLGIGALAFPPLGIGAAITAGIAGVVHLGKKIAELKNAGR